MGQFTDNAASIFEAAEAAMQTGIELSNMTIVIEREGGIRLIAESDWPMESLQSHHGARMVYRVTQQNGSVRLDGLAGTRTCSFESEKESSSACRLLMLGPAYQIIEGVPVLSPSRWQDLPGTSD